MWVKLVLCSPTLLSNQGPAKYLACTKDVFFGEDSVPLSGSQFFLKAMALLSAPGMAVQKAFGPMITLGMPVLTVCCGIDGYPQAITKQQLLLDTKTTRVGIIP